jgi:hypothetical protein
MTTVYDFLLEVLAADGWTVEVDPELGNVPVHAKGDALLLVRPGSRLFRPMPLRQRISSVDVFLARKDGSDWPVEAPVLDRFERWRVPSPWFFDEEDYPRVYLDAVLSCHDAAAVIHAGTGRR